MRVLRQFEAGAEGTLNMRRDEALLAAAATGAPPSLRLYRWARPTLSLGHAQRLEAAADPAALSRLGIPWVRRPTGGRALLHQPDELTYAFAAAQGAASGVRTAYRRVMSAIREALAGFLRLDPVPERRLRDRAASRLPCLAVPTGHEITVGGRKLVAGAQRWRRGAFLQHGSIPWTVDRRLTNEVAGLPPESPIVAVGLVELAAAGREETPPLVAVAGALSQSFADEFGGGSVLS